MGDILFNTVPVTLFLKITLSLRNLFFTLFFDSDVLLFFNWRIIALQCCVSFCHTTTSVSHKYTYILSVLNLLPISHPTPLGHHGAPGLSLFIVFPTIRVWWQMLFIICHISFLYVTFTLSVAILVICNPYFKRIYLFL